MVMFYRVDYSLFNAEGEVVDSSEGGSALAFIEGDETMMPGLEKAVAGRAEGDEFKVTIEPGEAYGFPQRSLIRTVSFETIEANVEDLQPGMIFQVGSGTEAEVVRVVEVEDEGITIDGNHPLAGVTFHFELKIIEVRQASADELELLAITRADAAKR
ncbi:FKBP-type peptidyl-prolyl cis-trans isomerase [Pseudomonadales bacterium]|nr:FKBP-type peptidyl-prolyl cis-trans isomerase [Pseudomonadales bacterium]MDB9866854.1 FKBP-type peptidyl-prolyl cis-trans isomerase [Pseudomonadales bacterium]MDC1307056.1 FKBP-type peptidyl-prolyl cis-trans isomerase [Pseudomonadales bacterium]|tara:strand:- start:485 stop:958 length:474 start_codon:yes stop_codon:yes gene_type:complete